MCQPGLVAACLSGSSREAFTVRALRRGLGRLYYKARLWPKRAARRPIGTGPYFYEDRLMYGALLGPDRVAVDVGMSVQQSRLPRRRDRDGRP